MSPATHPTHPTPRRVELRASLLMAVHCSALDTGGIGAGAYWTPGSDGQCPVCFIGHVWAAIPMSQHDADIYAIGAQLPPSLGADALTRLLCMNDDVVRAINARKGNSTLCARVPFEEWIAECEAQCNLEIIPVDDPVDDRETEARAVPPTPEDLSL